MSLKQNDTFFEHQCERIDEIFADCDRINTSITESVARMKEQDRRLEPTIEFLKSKINDYPSRSVTCVCCNQLFPISQVITKWNKESKNYDFYYFAHDGYTEEAFKEMSY